jgi:hypothetical protein
MREERGTPFAPDVLDAFPSIHDEAQAIHADASRS